MSAPDDIDLDDMTLIYGLRFVERQRGFNVKRILQFLDPEGEWKDVPMVHEDEERCGAV